MPDRRRDVAERLTRLVGPTVLKLEDLQDGWPALATLHIDETAVPVALFVAPVTGSHRGRDDVERRFQNPGQGRPVVAPNGRLPLLVGLYEGDHHLPGTRPLLVMADAVRRIGLPTRYSVFVPVTALVEASRTGWYDARSDSDETIRCILPPLLPAAVYADNGIAPDRTDLRYAIATAGLDEPGSDAAAADRARRTTFALVRDARFSRDVIAAYCGRCAMCGLGAPFVQGAHIYPASGSGSTDHPTNGLALCANHHLAFDRHLLAVEPETGKVLLHPTLPAGNANSAFRRFMDSTFPVLAAPADARATPAPDMFLRRYRLFSEHYEWLPHMSEALLF